MVNWDNQGVLAHYSSFQASMVQDGALLIYWNMELDPLFHWDPTAMIGAMVYEILHLANNLDLFSILYSYLVLLKS